MPKKSSASSPPALPTRASAESIWSKPLDKKKKSLFAKLAKQQQSGDDSQIDYSDIPAFTDKQLAQFSRPKKRLVAVRLDADIFEWLQKFGPGYSTRINKVLRVVMSQGQ